MSQIFLHSTILCYFPQTQLLFSSLIAGTFFFCFIKVVCQRFKVSVILLHFWNPSPSLSSSSILSLMNDKACSKASSFAMDSSGPHSWSFHFFMNWWTLCLLYIQAKLGVTSLRLPANFSEFQILANINCNLLGNLLTLCLSI